MPRIKLLRMAERTDHGVTVTLFSDGDCSLVRVREDSPFGCFDIRAAWADAWENFVHPYLLAPSYIPLPRFVPESDEVQAYAASITPAIAQSDGEPEGAAA